MLFLPPLGSIRWVDPRTGEFSKVSMKFSVKWEKNGSAPSITALFAVSNHNLEQHHTSYKETLSIKKTEEHFHGTSLTCNITASKTLCNDGNCGICGISCAGLDRQCIGKNIDFQRYGKGFYLAPNSSKCHDYTEGAFGVRAMLLCDVIPGQKYELQSNSQQRSAPPPGYDSVYGEVGPKLNYPEIVVYEPRAVMPRYIIVYKKDGTNHLLAK